MLLKFIFYQIVEYKQQLMLEEKRKKALDMHLNFIVDQTEKYSSWLVKGFADQPTGTPPQSTPVTANIQESTNGKYLLWHMLSILIALCTSAKVILSLKMHACKGSFYNLLPVNLCDTCISVKNSSFALKLSWYAVAVLEITLSQWPFSSIRLTNIYSDWADFSSMRCQFNSL